jgi:hypothetical protein
MLTIDASISHINGYALRRSEAQRKRHLPLSSSSRPNALDWRASYNRPKSGQEPSNPPSGPENVRTYVRYARRCPPNDRRRVLGRFRHVGPSPRRSCALDALTARSSSCRWGCCTPGRVRLATQDTWSIVYGRRRASSTHFAYTGATVTLVPPDQGVRPSSGSILSRVRDGPESAARAATWRSTHARH